MYLWLIAFHLIAVVCWFAALFYLPRLFIYHSLSDDQISIERFELMERKLFYLIANPAMIGTVILGIWIFLLAPQTYLWAEVVLSKNYFGCFINRIPSRLLGLHEKVGEKP